MTDRSIRQARGLAGILVMTALVAGACSAGGSGASSSPPPAASPSAATSVAPDPSATPTAEPIGGSITIYNAQHELLTQAWVDEFTKQTGVR